MKFNIILLFVCSFSAMTFANKLILKPDSDGVASGIPNGISRNWYPNGIGGRFLYVGQPNKWNRRDRVTFRFPIDRFIPAGRVKCATLVFAYTAYGKQKRENKLEVEHFTVERIELGAKDLLTRDVEAAARFVVPHDAKFTKVDFDVTEFVNADLALGFGFSAFRIRSVTADELGNTAMKSSFVLIEQNSMKLIIEP